MRKIWPFFVPTVLLLLWELAHSQGGLPPSLSASPTSIFVNAFDLLFKEDFRLSIHLGFSLIRIAVAVTTGAIAGVIAGISLHQISFLDNLLSPLLKFISPSPVVVWMPFVVLFVGAGEAYKLVLGAIATFLIVQSHVYAGVASISNDMIELARVYGLTPYQKLRHFIFPAVAPMFFVGLRLSLAIAWIVLFFVEFGSATQGSEGLGWFIANARAVGRVEDEYAGVFVLGAAGFASDFLMHSWQCWSLRWSDTAAIKRGLGMA